MSVQEMVAVSQEALHAWVNQLALQPLRVLIKASFFFAKFALTLGYAAGILLLLQRSRWRVWLGVFAPLGRMALTRYLLLSLVCTSVFYGFGLSQYGRMPLDLALGVLLFALQVVSSHWWLARFSIGPVVAVAAIEPRGHPFIDTKASKARTATFQSVLAA
jgi:uncharacterized protein